MEKIFKTGQELENGVYYLAGKKRYDIYPSDTVTLSDERYIGLRGNTDPEFMAFTVIKNKKDITLDFCGATIVFHGQIQPFVLDGSKNITIKNCNIRYSRPPFTELKILEKGDGYIRLKPNRHCTCRVEDGKLVPYGEDWENTTLDFRGSFFQVFDPKTCAACGVSLGATGKTFTPDPTFPYGIIPFCAEQDGDDIIFRGDSPDFYQPGRVLVIEHEKRNLSSVFAVDCKNLKIENYRILSGYGMGIFLFRTKDVTIDGFKLYHDRRSPCTVANAADAIHTFACTGKFHIKNCILEGMIDDGINFHSNFHTVDKTEDNVIFANVASIEIEAVQCFAAGDKIAVYNGPTMEKTAEYKILKIENVNKQIRKFTVDKPTAEHKKGDLIENISAYEDVTITNCRFAKANTHLRFQSRGKIRMKDCVTELPILLTGDANYWFEAGPVEDLVIQHCKFVGDRAGVRIVSEIIPTKREPYYHKNINIIENEFESDLPLSGANADMITFSNNVNSLKKPMTIELTNCGTVSADNCKLIRKTE